MTHYKNHWMQLLANRLKEQKRVIIKNDICASFLCYCIQNGMANTEVQIVKTVDSLIIK